MATFKLLDIWTGSLTEHNLGTSPAYIAASHAWSEQLFPMNVEFLKSPGREAIVATVKQRFPDISYCWVDTLCIDQNDDVDKHRQIPLMGEIFGGAVAVVIILSCMLNMKQSDIDELTEKLEPAIHMHLEESWIEDGAYWQSGKGRELVLQGMNGLAKLTRTAWGTRIWTLQEYILARNVIWIGQDLIPLVIKDILFSALPDICDTLVIDECIGDKFQKLYSYFSGMANVRLSRGDKTRVMELLGNRTATLEQDEVYGVMAAAGVEIPTKMNENKEDAWSRWFEDAVQHGHVRWLLTPVITKSLAITHRGAPSCILPPFSARLKVSASCALDTVKPLGLVEVRDGAAAISGRWLGECQVKFKLGRVHEPTPNRIHRDITLILFSQGNWKRACSISRVFGAGRYSSRQLTLIAQVLTKNWYRAKHAVLQKKEDGFRIRARGLQQQMIWSDFMEFQMGQMPGMNDGVAYLANMKRGSVLIEVVVVLADDQFIPRTRLDVLDLGGRTVDKRCIFMVVSGIQSNRGQKDAILHKIAVTLPVTGEYEELITKLPQQIFTIGGPRCQGCLEEVQHEPIPTSQSQSSKSLTKMTTDGSILSPIHIRRRRPHMSYSSTNASRNDRTSAIKMRHRILRISRQASRPTDL